MATVIAKSGATREIADDFHEPELIIGLDEEQRVVIFEDWMSQPFGLTLCCNASDKGMADGVGCRGCYGLPGEWVPEGANRKGEIVPGHYADAGNYLYWKNPDGSWRGLDPLDRIEGLAHG